MKITEEQVRKIEKLLAKGDRVEIIPVKNGYKVLKVSRSLVFKVEKPNKSQP